MRRIKFQSPSLLGVRGWAIVPLFVKCAGFTVAVAIVIQFEELGNRIRSAVWPQRARAEGESAYPAVSTLGWTPYLLTQSQDEADHE